MNIKLEILQEVERIIKPLNLHAISKSPKNYSEFVIYAEILEQIFKEIVSERDII